MEEHMTKIDIPGWKPAGPIRRKYKYYASLLCINRRHMVSKWQCEQYETVMVLTVDDEG
jgi:hypothetical protein